MNATISKSASVGGLSLAEQVTMTAPRAVIQDVSVPAGKVGSVAVRDTGGTTGTLTGPSGHGIITGQHVDLYWDGGSLRNVTVGTVTLNSIPVSGGTGDLLPAADTAITIAARTEVEFAFEGDDLVGLFLQSPFLGVIDIRDGSGSLMAKVFKGVWSWYADNGEDNPLAGDTPTIAYLSHSASTAVSLRLAALLNNPTY